MTLNFKVLLLFCLILPAGIATEGESTFVPRVHESCFYVAGYAIRTNNADEMSGHGKIGELWRRFLQKNLAGTIPHRTDESLVVVYSDYSSDEKGEFTYLLGSRVSSIRGLPPGLSYRKVVSGDYAVFATRVGPLVEVLQEEWKRIWKCQSDEIGGRRAFVTDYEVYDKRSADPMRAEIDIHIGVRPRMHSRKSEQ